MLSVLDNRIAIEGDLWVAACVCGKVSSFKAKNSAIRMLNRGVCSFCKPDYRSVKDADFSIYRRDDGKWCSVCSGCNSEQAYTRKDHAKQSSVSDWRCRKCRILDKSFSVNRAVGNEERLFNKFKKSAISRGIEWGISKEYMFSLFNGKCALTDWDISSEYGNATASLDRIDSDKGYIVGNIQWVHSIVNMSKNKYSQDLFIHMCSSVHKNMTR